jgi:hypothetical protein
MLLQPIKNWKIGIYPMLYCPSCIIVSMKALNRLAGSWLLNIIVLSENICCYKSGMFAIFFFFGNRVCFLFWWSEHLRFFKRKYLNPRLAFTVLLFEVPMFLYGSFVDRCLDGFKWSLLLISLLYFVDFCLVVWFFCLERIHLYPLLISFTIIFINLIKQDTMFLDLSL